MPSISPFKCPCQPWFSMWSFWGFCSVFCFVACILLCFIFTRLGKVWLVQWSFHRLSWSKGTFFSGSIHMEFCIKHISCAPQILKNWSITVKLQNHKIWQVELQLPRDPCAWEYTPTLSFHRSWWPPPLCSGTSKTETHVGIQGPAESGLCSRPLKSGPHQLWKLTSCLCPITCLPLAKFTFSPRMPSPHGLTCLNPSRWAIIIF